ncbi:MAG: hypothetical protein M1829_002842 [Trizodia sp. TS-e1964]|nr:MAG: hypothetical protein M1829_002842 [Trizodia sp. TS-e1964]
MRGKSGSPSPLEAQDLSTESSPASKAPQIFASLPFGAPEILVKNTIYVRDPARIYSIREPERVRSFQKLVRRYISQLLYGCQELHCTTPTCFSCQKRLSHGPLRKFTAVSARTIACYLACQDDPEKALCPHKPAISPALELAKTAIATFDQDTPPQSNNSAFPSSPANPGRFSLLEKRSTPESYSPQLCSPDEAHTHFGASSLLQPSSSGEKSQGLGLPKKIDHKSFTQNLFDTFPMKMLEWLTIPHPPNIFQFTPDTVGECHGTKKASIEESAASLSTTRTALASPPNNSNKEEAKDQHILQAASASELAKADEQVEPISNPVDSALLREPSFSIAKPDPIYTGLAQTSKGKQPKPGRFPSPITPQSQTTNIHPPVSLDRNTRRASKGAHSKTHSTIYKPARKESVNEARLSNFQQATPSRAIEKDIPSSTVQLDGASTHPSLNLGNHDIPPKFIQPPQSLSHLSTPLIRALRGLIKSHDVLSEDVRNFVHSFSLDKRTGPYPTPDLSYHESELFAEQTIFYVLGNPDTMLMSFQHDITIRSKSLDNLASSDLDSHEYTLDQMEVQSLSLHESFRLLTDQWRPHVLACLWNGIEPLFAPPPELIPPKSPKLKASRTSSKVSRAALNTETPNISIPVKYYTDKESAHIIIICLHALVATVPDITRNSWDAIRKLRSHGKVVPDTHTISGNVNVPSMLRVIEVLEDDLALRLTSRLLRLIASRMYIAEVLKIKREKGEIATNQSEKEESLMELIGNSFHTRFLDRNNLTSKEKYLPSSTIVIAIEWIRSVMIKEWNGKEEVNKWGSFGGAISLLAYIHRHRSNLGLKPEVFHTPFFSDRLDPMEIPVEWHSSTPNSKTLHLLSNSFLFKPSVLVTYFRSINFSLMTNAFEAAVTAGRLVAQMAFADPFLDSRQGHIQARLKIAISLYLVLEVRRDNVLEDALDQLWRREKRELMRPLKVRMGMDEGEEGVDHGGVQQEFFRMALGQALGPEYGMFTKDNHTQINWFQTCSPEPLYKYELLGLLVSLAIYNGLTLPLTFPKALYRKILGLPVTKLRHIEDGWPELCNGLSQLLSWKDGDVGDVFLRTYEFAVEEIGRTTNIDMEKTGPNDDWPSSREETGGAPQEAALVTNQNRHQYVRDYIFWLTDKSIRPQYEAFAKGFFSCLDRKAVSIFTPEALQVVIEGIQEIDIAALEMTARYEDGFDATHSLIKGFWQIVRQFTNERKRQLLEFVTASDRVPVNGLGSIMFCIQKNGPDSERLPTSLTCFGRLLLPEYSSVEKLEEKLRLALDNRTGFGTP